MVVFLLALYVPDRPCVNIFPVTFFPFPSQPLVLISPARFLSVKDLELYTILLR